MGIVHIKEFLKHHRPLVTLIGIVLVCTTLPVLDMYLVLGNAWQGVLPSFTDESVYYAHVDTIARGYVTDGNPFFFEHRNGPPLVIFGGAWINALPLFAGLSFNSTMVLNFIVWSLLFAASAYWLFRELKIFPWIAVCGVLFLYIRSYTHVWRAVNLQTVYPFFFLFHLALARFIREQSRKNIILLGVVTGVTFYLYAYLWQAAVITLSLLFLYALVQKNWTLVRATLRASLLGVAIGAPVPLYALWLSHSSPYFWESVGRLGLVNTHLPMAEVVYSGGWIGVVIVFLAVLYLRSRTFREDKEFILLGLFLTIGGLGLWIMQGSNLITGKLLETGEHLAGLISLWFAFSTLGLGAFLWNQRAQIVGRLRFFSVVVGAIFLVANGYYFYRYFPVYFLPANIDRVAWQTQESYAKPFAWLESEEKNPVVVWSDSDTGPTISLPAFTAHFVLFSSAGLSTLVSENEIRERYLVSQYFNNPTIADLKNTMGTYLGRYDIPHHAKTIERGIKICRILFFWDRHHDCGMPPTSQELLGEKFFIDLENKFQDDIKPNIRLYLKKYHVSYILKDKVLNSQYHPEVLGARLVYGDNRYEIWHL